MTDTILSTIQMQPGIRKDLTDYQAEGGWTDCNRIRFQDGRAKTIGGWAREQFIQFEDPTNTLFTGVARAIHPWAALDQKRLLAVAGTEKVELVYDGEIYDITPITVTVALTNAISTTSSSSIVTITDTVHNRTAGDWIYVNSQAVAVATVTLAGRYQVVEVLDANNYTLDASPQVANATIATSGGAFNVSYLLPSGSQDNIPLIGWSGGTWNTPGAGGAGYNRPRNATDTLDLREWSLDNWGEDLLACPHLGGIYQWDRTNGPTVRLQPIANAPETNHMILIAQSQRTLIALGSETFATSIFDPLIIRWAAIGTLTDWAISSLSTAGEYRIPTGNKIISAVQTRSEILVFTDVDVYAMRFVGGLDVFQFTCLGNNTSCASLHAPIDVSGIVYWMGFDNFYFYDGAVQIMPSPLGHYLFNQGGDGLIKFEQKEKTFGGINKEFNEIWWFYQRFDDTDCQHYIKYNYLEKVWDFGTLERTVWTDKGIFSRPYAVNVAGRMYAHETGVSDDSTPINAFITSAYFDIADGDELLFVDRVVPDLTMEAGSTIQVTVKTKKYPHPGADIITKGPYNFTDNNRKISMRARGRQMALTFTCNATNSNFEIGKIRISAEPDGGR